MKKYDENTILIYYKGNNKGEGFYKFYCKGAKLLIKPYFNKQWLISTTHHPNDPISIIEQREVDVCFETKYEYKQRLLKDLNKLKTPDFSKLIE